MIMRHLLDGAGYPVVFFEDGDFCSLNATKRACLKYVRSEIQGDSFTGLLHHEYILRNRKMVSDCDWIILKRHSKAL